MKLGNVTVSDQAAAERLKRLFDQDRIAPYKGKAAQGSTLEGRLAGSLAFLQARGFDAQVAAILISCVEYMTEANKEELWRNAAEEARNGLHLSQLAQCPPTWILALPRESHVNEFFQAIRIDGRRNQPFADLVDLWTATEHMENPIPSQKTLDNVRKVREAKCWLVLWDFALSGMSVVSRLKSLKIISQVIHAHPQLAVGCAVLSARAAEHFSDALGKDVVVYAGRRMANGESLDEKLKSRGYDGSIVRRAHELCARFHQEFVLSDARLRNRKIGVFGYNDGKFLLAYQSNCANNSIPLLWHYTEDYPAPFPRSWSDPLVQPSTPEKLEKLRNSSNLKELTWWRARVAYVLPEVHDTTLRVEEVGGPENLGSEPDWWSKDFAALRDYLVKSDPVSTESARTLSERIELSTSRFPYDCRANAFRCSALAACAFLSLQESLADSITFLSRARKLESSIPDLSEYAEQKQLVGMVHQLLAQRVLGEGRVTDIGSAINAVRIATAIEDLPPPRGLLLRQLPSYRYHESGVPPLRRLEVESHRLYTTRASDAAARAKSLNESDRGIFLLVGPLGTGKTTFLRSLEAIQRPVLFIDLIDAVTDHKLARALLEDVQLSPTEITEVDGSPISVAGRLLSELLHHPSVVVMENADRALPSLAPGFARTVEELCKRGHTVVIERWTETHAFVRDFKTWTLLPIEKAELPAWGSRLAGRPLRQYEIDAIDSYADGNPLFAGWMARSLSSLSGGEEDAELAAIEACEEAQVEANNLLHFLDGISGVAIQVGEHFRFSDELAAWLGALPYVDIVADRLTDGEAAKGFIERLRRAGLVTLRAGGWHADPWCRAMGLWRIEQSPEVLGSRSNWLEQNAATIAPDMLDRQRQYLHVLGRRVPAVRGACNQILEALPLPSQLGGAAFDVETYEAPLPAETAVGALPPDLRLWELESASRVGNRDMVLGHFERLINQEVGDATTYIAGNWGAIRKLHHALLRLPVGPKEKSAIYKKTLPLLGDALQANTPAIRFWCSRFLAFAARTAMAAGEVEKSQQWIQLASNALDGAAWGDGEAALQANLDTRYRLARAASTGGSSLPDIQHAHRLAYDAIPDAAKWPRHRVAQWALRRLRHLKALLRQGDVALLPVLKETFLLLPPSLRWFQEWARYFEDSDELPEGMKTVLDDVLKAQFHRLNEAGVDPRLKDLCKLLVREKPYHLAIGVLKDAAEVPADTALDLLDIELIRRATALCLKGVHDNLFEGINAGSSTEVMWKQAGEASNTLLKQLDAAVMRFGDDFSVLKARRLSLALATAAKCCVLRTESRRKWKKDFNRQVDGMYRNRASSGSDPWLWAEWAFARIDLARSAGSAGVEMDLRRFLEEERKMAGGDRSFDVAALLIGKYLWDYGECYIILRRLVTVPMLGEDRVKIVRWGVDALRHVVLQPPELKAWASEEDETGVKDLFVGLLRELQSALGENTLRAIVAEILCTLERENDPVAWDEIATAWELRIGKPDELWPKFIELINSEENQRTEVDQQTVDQLADIQRFSSWARIFRRGACDLRLPRGLRLRLALLEVSATNQIASLRGGDHVFSNLNRGVAIGIALRLSDGQTIFGDKLSDEMDGKRRRIPWPEILRVKLDRAVELSQGRGRFHEHVVHVRDWLCKLD